MDIERNSDNLIQETYLIDTFPLIKQIVSRQVTVSDIDEAEDLVQEVKLGLLIWKRNRSTNQYTREEWLKIANTSAYNEIRTFYSRRSTNSLSLSTIDEDDICNCAKNSLSVTRLEGSTNMELHSLLVKIWEVIQRQTLIEHYALLLKNDELFLHLLSYRGCDIKEMAEKLHLQEIDVEQLVKEVPLTDKQITVFLQTRLNRQTTPQALRKARQRATKTLQVAINGMSKTNNNGKTPAAEKT